MEDINDKVIRLEIIIARLEEKFIASEEAKKLQAIEYERRLETLNHSHAQSLEAQSRTVPREVYDRDREVTDRWRNEVRELIARTKGQTSVYMWVLGTGGIGWVVLSHFWKW